MFTGLALLLMTAATGCFDNPADKKLDPKFLPKAKAKVEEKRTALEAPGRGGMVRGKVVYDGEPPEMKPIDKLSLHFDREECLKGTPAELRVPTWLIDKETKAVANIVVSVEPPAGKFFTLTEEEKNRAGDLVVIDQPHCAFVPHVVSIFPAYFDGAKEVKTGQKLEFRNSAKMRHSVQWSMSYENEAATHNIPPGEKKQIELNPQKHPLTLGCGDHGWMHGHVWIFDHPFHAVTKEDGTFEIKNLPTDVELTFKAFHELRRDPFEVRKMTFKKGDNPFLELKIKQAPFDLKTKK